MLGDFVFHHHVARRLIADARVGVGLDIVRIGYKNSSDGIERSDTGLAIEASVGLWYSFGVVQLGGELAIPIAFHDALDVLFDVEGQGVELPIHYTSCDLEAQLGARVVLF